MVAQILIYKQGIECRGIKSRKKHSNYNDQVDLFVLYSFCQVTIIVLKLFAVNTITGFKHCIIVIDGFR